MEDAGGAAVVLDAGGGVKVVVAVVTAALVTPPDVVLLVDVVVCVAVAFAFSAGTASAAPGRATEACPPPAESPAANVPASAGVAEVDFTALPIPKPAAIAITTNAPSSSHRRSMFPPSLRPVPEVIVVALAGSVRVGPVAQSVRAADS